MAFFKDLWNIIRSFFMGRPNVVSFVCADTEVEIAALGRPAALGMLYDIRRNKLIIGKTLWSLQELEANVATVPRASADTEILDIKCSSDKAKALKVEVSLKLDVLCKTVDVEGAGSYLSDGNDSKRQTRVVLKHERKTELRHLTMEHLKADKISHPEILDEYNATHVIIGIQYGGNVIMEFSQEVSKEGSSQEVQANMKAHVEKLKGVVSCDVNANVKKNGTNTQENKQIKCHVYSDFLLEENPSTYEEAVQFLKKLPSSLKESKGVPVVLYLCPLKSYRSSLEKRYPPENRISPSLIDKVCAIIEHLQFVIAECQDLIQEDNFPILKLQLELFMEAVQQYKGSFPAEISKFRDGSERSSKLDCFLKEHEASVFSRSQLSKWLEGKKEKMKMLQGIKKSLKDTPFVSSGDLDAILCDPTIRHVVCLSFGLSLEDDIQLLNMQAFLNNDLTRRPEESAWPLDITLVREPLKRFLILREDNEHNHVAKFVVTEEPLTNMGYVSDTPGVFVRYYFEGRLRHKNLMPLSKPNLRTSKVLKDQVDLVWDNSLTKLNGIEDKVHYRKMDSKTWETSSVVCQQRTATIQGLSPATKYQFRIRAPGQIFLRENDESLEVTTQQNEISSIRRYVYGCVESTLGKICSLIFAWEIKTNLKEEKYSSPENNRSMHK